MVVRGRRVDNVVLRRLVDNVVGVVIVQSFGNEVVHRIGIVDVVAVPKGIVHDISAVVIVASARV